MEDLAYLQKKLIDIQKTGGSFKLSERTVVDIIQKVLNRGKLKIIFSTNGKDFVTEEKISKEISDEIKKNKGRIAKADLVKILDIPANILDSRVNLLLSKEKNISLIENKLIANYYLDEITSEIKETLRLSGSLMLSDLSTKYDELLLCEVPELIKTFRD